jgi:hypothetical protein
MAVEYIKRHKTRYNAIFWVNANDQDSSKLSFVGIAQQILRNHPSSALASVDLEENLDAVVDAVKAWFTMLKNTR